MCNKIFLGVYSGENEFLEGDKLFVSERETLGKLVSAVGTPCSTCRNVNRFLSSICQVSPLYKFTFNYMYLLYISLVMLFGTLVKVLNGGQVLGYLEENISSIKSNLIIDIYELFEY